ERTIALLGEPEPLRVAFFEPVLGGRNVRTAQERQGDEQDARDGEGGADDQPGVHARMLEGAARRQASGVAVARRDGTRYPCSSHREPGESSVSASQYPLP